MDHDLSAGDIVTVYFGGATDTGVGKAKLRVDTVGETIDGTAVHQLQKPSGGDPHVSLSDSKWRIESSEIHAVHWHGDVETANVIAP